MTQDPNPNRTMIFHPDGAYMDGVKIPGLAEWIATGECPDSEVPEDAPSDEEEP